MVDRSLLDQHSDFESTHEAFPVKLEMFEGPLDLLLHLIRKNEVNIHDIPIALITAQYLDAIHLMQELDLDVAGEFLVMAATLIHIKSKLLLPRPETAAGVEGEEEDPRDTLVRLSETQACGFEELFADADDRGALVVTFLALLEMIRLKLVRVFQSSSFGPIRVYKRARPADAPHPIGDSEEHHG